MSKFEIYKSKAGKYHFRLKSKNGQIVLASQGYAAKPSAKNGIESVRKNGTLDERFDRKESANGKFFFNLLAGNRQTIGSSQMYASADSRDKGIESVKNNCANAEVEDQTTA